MAKLIYLTRSLAFALFLLYEGSYLITKYKKPSINDKGLLDLFFEMNYIMSTDFTI